ncbi:hypothetical protein AKO1_007146 [Acrasis kona]|uniref:Uncharacterized protein n=1 Tax=Acrasis kona TaxID=1008807 RepID=A0AAW2YS64_9EUKA
MLGGIIHPLNDTLNTIWSYRDSNLQYLYETDGLRLMLFITLLLIPVFIPITVLFLFCFKNPCSLLVFSIQSLLISMVSWSLVSTLLPLNIFSSDTCLYMESYVVGFAESYPDTFYNKNITVSQQIMSMNISLNVVPSDVLACYLGVVPCVNNSDPLTRSISDLSAQVQSINFGSVANNELLNLGFKLLPKGYELIDTLADPVINAVVGFASNVTKILNCNSVNQQYTQTKSCICDDISNIIASTNLVFVLLGSLFSFASLLGSLSYYIMSKHNNTKLQKSPPTVVVHCIIKSPS